MKDTHCLRKVAHPLVVYIGLFLLPTCLHSHYCILSKFCNAYLYLPANCISGAVYKGVPVFVNREYLNLQEAFDSSSGLKSFISLETLKSRTFIRSSFYSSMKTLVGFMSLWTTPFSCIYFITSITYLIMTFDLDSLQGPFL
jgi:hypothetical protein